MNDAPLYEEDLSNGRTTARVTVDVAEGGMYATLALEPDDGELRQMVFALTPERAHALAVRLHEAAALMDELGRRAA